MKPSITFVVSAAALAIVTMIAPALAQDTPHDMRDMVNARAGQAEGELGRRGYVWVRVESGGDRKWSYWWNAGKRQCLSITTTNGRYASIVTTRARDCRKSAGRPGL